MSTTCWLACLLAGAGAHASAAFPDLDCAARNTAGFHDYVGGVEDYEASVFHASRFSVALNQFLMDNLAKDTGVQLYLTMTDDKDEVMELECRTVRGSGSEGLSCVNIPPSELLLINTSSWRFTRTSVGGWAFASARDNINGDSIFVEYGQCHPAE